MSGGCDQKIVAIGRQILFQLIHSWFNRAVILLGLIEKGIDCFHPFSGRFLSNALASDVLISLRKIAARSGACAAVRLLILMDKSLLNAVQINGASFS